MLSSMTLEGHLKGARHSEHTPRTLLATSTCSKTLCQVHNPSCSSAPLMMIAFPSGEPLLTSEPQQRGEVF